MQMTLMQKFSTCKHPTWKCLFVLLQLTIQDVHTNELLTFDFSRFIGEIGGDICKELPAIRANTEVLRG